MFISIPNFDLLPPSSSRDKELMGIDIAMKIHKSFQLHQLSIVRLNMKVIFLSDIVYQTSNVVKTYYIPGNPEITASSSYTWPTKYPSHKVNKICINFIIYLTSEDRSLMIYLASNQLLSFHRHSITSMSEDKTHL